MRITNALKVMNFIKIFTTKGWLAGLAIGLLLISSCTRTVSRISSDQQVDLSGRWNNTDSRLTAQALLEDILSGGWYSKYTQAHNGNVPTIVVGMIVNKTHEHIEAETFIKDMERSFINSGKVRVVQGGKRREELRAEKGDQQANSTVESMKRFGLEHGADYILQGSINSIVDAIAKKKVAYYQINLELTDLETNEIVWIGEKKIAKFIKN